MKYRLYKLTFSSGKIYIGQTIDKISKRMTRHRQGVKWGSKLAVHNAWRKYGEPEFEIIGEYKSHEDLHHAEIKAIKEYNTLVPNGYNLSKGGETAPSKNPIVATKISELAKGRLHTKKTKKLLTKKLKERWKDTEYQEKVSKGLKKAWTSEMKKERSKFFKEMWAKRKAEGWKMPESTKEKLRNKTFSEETRNKMSEAAKKRIRKPMTKEQRQAISERVKKDWQNKELSERRIKAIRKAKGINNNAA